jgi:hypothetical protein
MKYLITFDIKPEYLFNIEKPDLLGPFVRLIVVRGTGFSIHSISLMKLLDCKLKKEPRQFVHAGKDFVLNTDESLTGFVNKAVPSKVPFTLIHYATGIHGFDVYADNKEIREIINTTLEFWKYNLKIMDK